MQPMPWWPSRSDFCRSAQDSLSLSIITSISTLHCMAPLKRRPLACRRVLLLRRPLPLWMLFPALSWLHATSCILRFISGSSRCSSYNASRKFLGKKFSEDEDENDVLGEIVSTDDANEDATGIALVRWCLMVVSG